MSVARQRIGDDPARRSASRPRTAGISRPGSSGPDLALALTYGGWWRRFFAALADILLFVVGSGAVMTLLELALGRIEGYASWERWVFISLAIAYFTIMESSRYAGTYGKRLLGLVVVRQSGARLTRWLAALRFFGRIVSYLLLCVGLAMLVLSKRKLTLHDRGLRTVVVVAKWRDIDDPAWIALVRRDTAIFHPNR